MPAAANKKGKGGNKRRKGKKGGHGDDAAKEELLFAEDGQAYARIERPMGSGRFEAYCFDGTKRQVHVRGTMHKRIWINKDDIVLIGIRDFQPGKADIIHKYSPEHAQKLVDYNELPSDSIRHKKGEESDNSNDDGDGGVTFTNEAGEEQEDDDEKKTVIDLEDL